MYADGAEPRSQLYKQESRAYLLTAAESYTKILLETANGTLNLSRSSAVTTRSAVTTTPDGWLLDEIDDFEKVNYELNDKDHYVPYVERPETYIVPIVFLVILLVGVTGNGILVLTLLRHANMRNVPNTYVLSLALGDLLVIITCVPFTSTLYTIESWPWGLAVCKLSECAKDISIGVSVFTLTALSAERYCAIVNPIRRHVVGLSAKPLTILTASLIWVFSIILSTPDALFAHVPTIDIGNNRSIQICSPFPGDFGEDYEKGMVLFKFLAYYVIPLCIIAGFYFGMARHLVLSTRNMPGEVPGAHRSEQIRARKKVGKMVIAFVAIFIVCFLPYHVFMLWFHFYPYSKDEYNDFWHAFRILGFCLSFINSCVNPIALYCVSGAFRKRFNEYLCCLGARTSRNNRYHESSPRARQRNASTFYETSFNSTYRRYTQEFNSTVLQTTSSPAHLK